jgi:ferrous iron transport protein A
MKTKFNFTAGQQCALSDLVPGQRARVQGVDVSTPAGRRLLDLGFLPDTVVAVLRTAPLGDPAVYEIRGYRLCLRRADAAHIRVRVEENG